MLGGSVISDLGAGGAVIGYFSSSAGSRWTTADPVTGTTVCWTGSNGAWEKETEQTEPLGQMISNYDPDLEGDPTYETAARNAGFPQWQCSLPDTFWGENPDEAFHSMPFECRFAEMLRRANEGDELWKLLPKRESTATASDMPKDKHAAKIVNGHQMAFNKLALFTLNAVRKGMDDSGGGHAEGDHENVLGVVNVEIESEPIETGWVEPSIASVVAIDEFVVPDGDGFKKLVTSFFESYGKAFRRCVWEIFSKDKDGNESNVATVMKTPSSSVFPYADVTIYKRIIGAEGFVENGKIGLKASYSSSKLYDGTFVSGQEQFFRTLAHEYANYLSWFYSGSGDSFGLEDGIRGDGDSGGGQSINVDRDTGARMEKCIWGNTSY